MLKLFRNRHGPGLESARENPSADPVWRRDGPIGVESCFHDWSGLPIVGTSPKPHQQNRFRALEPLTHLSASSLNFGMPNPEEFNNKSNQIPRIGLNSQPADQPLLCFSTLFRLF